MKKLEITVKIKDEDGNDIVTKISEGEVPFLEEFQEEGFRAAFDKLETAVIETRKEVMEGSISEYLEVISKKKRNLRQEMEKHYEKKPTE
jgi:predicted HAD superfamily phosphohydrolase